MDDTSKLDETPLADPLLRPIAHGRSRSDNSVKVDLAAIVDGCRHVIADRGFVGYDGSPPMVALSADVVLAVASFAQELSTGILQEPKTRTAADAERLREFAAAGPYVGGGGAADAEGETVHHIHVSAIRDQGVQRDVWRQDGSYETHAARKRDLACALGIDEHTDWVLMLHRVKEQQQKEHATRIRNYQALQQSAELAQKRITELNSTAVDQAVQIAELRAEIRRLMSSPCALEIVRSEKWWADHTTVRSAVTHLNEHGVRELFVMPDRGIYLTAEDPEQSQRQLALARTRWPDDSYEIREVRFWRDLSGPVLSYVSIPSAAPGTPATHEKLLDVLGYIRAECGRLRARVGPTNPEHATIESSLDAIIDRISVLCLQGR